jgi:triphosphoribosyl-dephospho-CoA synthase
MAAPVATTVTPRAARAVSDLASGVGSRGWCAAVAGVLEATAEKPGNVHPRRPFPDLTHDDLVAAATAIAPAMDRAPTTQLGRTIRDAVAASRAAVDTNANLGIVLLTAPLAAVPDGVALDASAVDDVLASLDAADASDVWQAIARARPGGLGHVDRDDVHGPPPGDLRAAMRAAADRDLIARMWAEGFDPLFTGPVADLRAALAAGMPPLDAIVECHLRQLGREPDSLITRRHGLAAAREVTAGAAAILRLPPAERPAAVAAFDASLRSPRRLNPGTTADIVAAALYILLRSGDLLPRFLPTMAPS